MKRTKFRNKTAKEFMKNKTHINRARLLQLKKSEKELDDLEEKILGMIPKVSEPFITA